jgi:hypothetical protein
MLRDNEQRSEEQMRGRLEDWIGKAKTSGGVKLKTFVTKLVQDMEPVVAALVVPYTARAKLRASLTSSCS